MNWQQAAIWLRHKLGHPDERWLDELLDMASGIAGAAQQFQEAGQERERRSIAEGQRLMARPRIVTRTWTDRQGVKHQAYVVKRTHHGKAQQDSQHLRKKDAEERLRQWERELEEQTYVPKRERWTFQQVVEDKNHGWRAELRRRERLGLKLGADRLYGLENLLKNHLLPESARARSTRSPASRCRHGSTACCRRSTRAPARPTGCAVFSTGKER